MAISEDFIITEFFSQRKNAIIEFIIKHPECTINEVKVFCDNNKIASKETVEKILTELEKEGRLTNRPNSHDKRARSLTIDSENLLIILPSDFEELYSRFQFFVMAIKEWSMNPEDTFRKYYGEPERKIDCQLIANLTILLPYKLMNIIDQIYNAYFAVVLPEKINKKEHIQKLNLLYYRYVSQMRSFVFENLQECVSKFNFYSSDRSIRYHYLINVLQRPTFDDLVRLILDCHAYSLQKQLFDILNFLWERNIDIAYDQYTPVYGCNGEVQNGIIDKSCLETKNPKLRAVYKSICNFMTIEKNLFNQPRSNYYYEEEEDPYLDKIFSGLWK